MTPDELRGRLTQGPLFLDGGLGTLFIAQGLPPGAAPETWIALHPERLVAAHREYVDAGADVIHTVTFGGTPTKLAAAGIGEPCCAVNTAAARLAQQAGGGRALVAGDVGPTGRFFPPTGDAEEEGMLSQFSQQAEALWTAGVDLISIETMFDLREAICATRAAVATGLAVICSMTFEQKRRGFFTMMGDPLRESFLELQKHGVTAVGMNCSVTSTVMLQAVTEVAPCLSVPLAVQPNAGQPQQSEQGVTYLASPEEFAADLCAMHQAGASILGGCCGTTPAFIRQARVALNNTDR